MVKRLIAATITAVTLLLPVRSAAEAVYPLTYERAEAFMNLNSGTLKKLERAENSAFSDYRSYELRAKTMDTEGFSVTYGGKEYYIHYNLETKIAMKKAKELYPEQMKFSWEAARDNRTVTINTLKTSLRGVFLGVYSADADVKLKQKQLDLAAKVNGQDKLKLDRGMITDLDMQESDYNLLKAQKSLDAAKRNYENAVRSFNQFVGLPAKTAYSDVVFEEKLSHPDWKPVDYYIEQALSNRFDIVSIRKQLALKEQEKNIIESSYIYKMGTASQIEHENLLNDIEQLNIDLEGMELSITDEVRNAYVDVIKAGKEVDGAGNTLKLQQSSYSKMQARYKAGLISANTLAQAEIGLMQVEIGYNAKLYDYHTKMIRFQNSAGIGPAY